MALLTVYHKKTNNSITVYVHSPGGEPTVTLTPGGGPPIPAASSSYEDDIATYVFTGLSSNTSYNLTVQGSGKTHSEAILTHDNGTDQSVGITATESGSQIRVTLEDRRPGNERVLKQWVITIS